MKTTSLPRANEQRKVEKLLAKLAQMKSAATSLPKTFKAA